MRATGSQTPFVGRRRELARLESHLAGDGLPAVLFLWGPGGVGKTALLRHVRARDGDRCWLWLRGEDLEASAPLPRARERPPAVVVVDSFERASKRGAEKWNAFLAALPAHTRVLMAGRKASGWEWREPGWDTTVRMMELGPLDRESADELLSAVGIADPLLREELVVWSGGEPLSLLAGAETVARRGRLIESDPLLLAALSARLLRGEENEGTGPLTAAEGRRVLDVAAVARAMDRPTLEAVMPGVDARAALTWLESLSVTHHLGARLALQDRLRHTIKTRLQCASPDGYREITRRLTEHFANRARTGEPRFLLDLAELIDDPSLRWAMGTEAGRALRTGPPRPEDEPVLEGHLNPRRWSLLVRWLREAPTMCWSPATKRAGPQPSASW
ncbi:MAG: ATP-binding protein [Actinomycetota bacterium]